MYLCVCMSEILAICFHHQIPSRILQGSGMQTDLPVCFTENNCMILKMPLVEQNSIRYHQAKLPWNQGVHFSLIPIHAIEAVKQNRSMFHVSLYDICKSFGRFSLVVS